MHEQIVDLIYEAAGEEVGWQDVLTAISSLVNAAGGHIWVFDAQGELFGNWCDTFDPGDADLYLGEFQHRDPRSPLAMAHPGRTMSDVEVIDPYEFERSAIYNDLFRKMGLRFSLFGVYPLAGGTSAGQGFLRPPTGKPFGKQEIRRFERIQPHLRRGLGMWELLRDMREQVADLRALLDRIRVPVAILEKCGRLICASGRAETLMMKGTGVLLQQQRLTAARPRDASNIAQALEQAARLAAPSSWRSTTSDDAFPGVVEITQESAPPLRLVFLPLRSGRTLDYWVARRARVLVLFDDQQAVRLDADLVARLYGLTPTEARLAAALAEGQTLGTFAAARGCSEETARTHLKRVLDKTGMHRQADLVRLLVGGVALGVASQDKE